jgi:hypothetical protein
MPKTAIEKPTRPKRARLADPQPEWGDLHFIERNYSLRKTLIYQILPQVESVLLKRPGATRGKRLVNLASLRRFLASQEAK